MTGGLEWGAVAVLGAAGALARWRVSAAVAARRPRGFPFGTFAVNLTGAFTLGVLTGAGVTGDALLLAGTGLLGSYTTFSTWMVEAHRLREGHAGRMWLYLAASMAGGLAATGLGWAAGGTLS